MRKDLVWGRVWIFVLLGVVGCGGDFENEFSFDRDVPDEFSVTRRRPLTIPPDLYLRPPRDETRSEDLEVKGVIDVIAGRGVVDAREGDFEGSEALGGFLRSLGVFEEVPLDIRSRLEGVRKDRLYDVEEVILEEMTEAESEK